MQRAPVFITGTSTGVGKTVLTGLLARWLRDAGHRVAALKPVCSGDRADARWLAAALGGELALDEINPWHFRAPVAPVLAARRAGKTVTLDQISTHALRLQASADWLLVEGAGGLLSPLAEKVDSRDLILSLQARPVIVGPNQLGVINHLRLTLAALPPEFREQSLIVLMAPASADAATRSNAGLLAEYFPAGRVLKFPWLGPKVTLAGALEKPDVRKVLGRLTAMLGP